MNFDYGCVSTLAPEVVNQYIVYKGSGTGKDPASMLKSIVRLSTTGKTGISLTLFLKYWYNKYMRNTFIIL